jgi:sigma-B regulation protein RsbU (phosphoserine phosphatase)
MSIIPEPSDALTAERMRAELGFMYELCQVVASNSELKPILDWIVQKTTSMFEADEGSIRLLTEEEATPTARTLVRNEQPGIQSGSWPGSISMNVMGFLMARGEPLASPDLPNDSRFPALRPVETRIRSVLAVPLKAGNRFTGMLAVTAATPGRQWTRDEIQLLSIVASNSASVIEQARLKIEAEEKRRLEERQKQLERELDTARGIQMSLLPSRPLRLGPWEIAGRVVPARQVGGDAFDFFPVGENRAGIVIADVSGKGVPAALLTSNVQASIRAFCDGRTRIPDAIRSVNEGILRSASGKFITLFFAEIDAARGVVRYTNAGHNYPLLRRANGTITELSAGGFPLGLIEDASYEQGEAPFGPTDSLLLYSDGITEALDVRGAEFGEEPLRALWQAEGADAPAGVIEHIFTAVESFRGRALQNDDMTLVVVGAPSP